MTGGRPSDPLAAIIALLRPRTILSKIVSGAGRWSVRYAPYLDPAFGLMLEGSCFLDVDGVLALRRALPGDDYLDQMRAAMGPRA